jgi:hypothetical protein
MCSVLTITSIVGAQYRQTRALTNSLKAGLFEPSATVARRQSSLSYKTVATDCR